MNDGTAGPWRVQRIENTTYPDLPTFNVMAPNPDAGKKGVVYAGREFLVTHGLDSEADARLIAEAPAMLEALREIIRNVMPRDVLTKVVPDFQLDAARAVLDRLEQP